MGGRDIQEDAAGDQRGELVDAVRDETPALEGLLDRHVPMQHAVVGHVREGVGVCADMTTGDDELVGCGSPVGANHVPMTAQVGQPKTRMVGRGGHLRVHWLREVDHSCAAGHGVDERLRAGHDRPSCAVLRPWVP